MGQSYFVRVKIVCRDEKNVLKHARRFMEDTSGSGRACYKYTEIRDLEGMLRQYFTDDVEKGDDGVYSAGFNASYGWEGIMAELFSAISPALEDGSFLEVYPDSGRAFYEKKDGKVITTLEDTWDGEDDEGLPSTGPGQGPPAGNDEIPKIPEMDPCRIIEMSIRQLVDEYGEDGNFIVYGKEYPANVLLQEVSGRTEVGKAFCIQVAKTICQYFMRFGEKL